MKYRVSTNNALYPYEKSLNKLWNFLQSNVLETVKKKTKYFFLISDENV